MWRWKYIIVDGYLILEKQKNFYLENGEVYSWGFGEDGQLGLNNKESQYFPQAIQFEEENIKIIEISAGFNHSFFITSTEILQI